MSYVSVVLLFLLGLLLIVKGGDWFLDGAVWIAEATGVPRFIIGATVVSLATTLPELTVSITGVLENQVDMAVGNAVGSVTANLGLIMRPTRPRFCWRSIPAPSPGAIARLRIPPRFSCGSGAPCATAGRLWG